MHISWLGQTCIKLQTKNKKDEDIVVLIDPYKPETGDFPRSFTPNIGIFSRGQKDAVTLSQNPFIIDTLGEIESKDVMIYALPGDGENIIYKINAEGLNLVHLGKMTKKIDDSKLEKVGAVDILFVPVGGKKEYLEPADAAQITTALEPRMVIPIGHQCDTDPKAGSLSDFIKEIGIKPEITDKKIIIKKKDLPQEETKLVVLEKIINMAKRGTTRKKTNDAKSKNIVVTSYRTNEAYRKIMWIGVLIISAIIVSLWTWSFTTRIASINIALIPEKEMLNETKKNWNEIFEETKVEEEKKQILKQLKTTLNEILINSTNSEQDSIDLNIPTTTIITTTTKQQ